ncbi:MAG: hypothetical protein LBH40_05100 [Alphaproteobacteria bacterium]|jgi:hypothetical protein|nr:hypothetical protein [Alphaproteobacteria bacterium]
MDNEPSYEEILIEIEERRKAEEQEKENNNTLMLEEEHNHNQPNSSNPDNVSIRLEENSIQEEEDDDEEEEDDTAEKVDEIIDITLGKICEIQEVSPLISPKANRMLANYVASLGLLCKIKDFFDSQMHPFSTPASA